jgi:hypothetical protein
VPEKYHGPLDQHRCAHHTNAPAKVPTALPTTQALATHTFSALTKQRTKFTAQEETMQRNDQTTAQEKLSFGALLVTIAISNAVIFFYIAPLT